jgi:hypothetical protein
MQGLRITFSSETAARAAVKTIERYGYAATATGSVVRTNCPPLLAVPAVGRDDGLHQMEHVRFSAVPGECAPDACGT